MRTTVLIAFAIGAGLTLAALTMAANGFTVWTGVWIVACGLAGTAVWIRLKAHLGEARRSREFNDLRTRMFNVLNRQRRYVRDLEDAECESEAAAARHVSEMLDEGLQ